MNAATQTKTPGPFAAWLATLPERDRHWPSVMAPVRRASLFMTAIAKACLQQNMPAADRLRFSELLDRQSRVIPAGAIALIQPAGAAELELFSAACKSISYRKDAEGNDRGAKLAFDILSTPRMFDLLITANPSVLTALKFEVEQRAPAAGATSSEFEAADAIDRPQSPTAMGAAQFAHMQRRSNGTPARHRSHLPPDQISRMGGGLPDWTFDVEKDSAI